MSLDTIMEDNVYEKIWSMLSAGDKKVLTAIAKNGTRLTLPRFEVFINNINAIMY